MTEAAVVVQNLLDITEHSEPSSDDIVLGFYGSCWKVATNCPSVRPELLDRLYPFVGIDESNRAVPAGPSITAVLVDHLPDVPQAPSQRMQTRPVASARPQYFDCYGVPSRLAVSRQTGSMVVGSEDGNVKIFATDPAALAMETRRLLQDLLHIDACHRGMLNAEAAALRVAAPDGDRGVLILGPSGTGKSTLLGRLAALTDVQYVANDEVFLLRHRGRFRAHGSPVNVKVGETGAKRSLPYSEFCAARGLRITPHLQIDAVLIPHSPDRQARTDPDALAEMVQNLTRWTERWPSPWTSLAGPTPTRTGPDHRFQLRDLRTVPAYAVPWSVTDDSLVFLVTGERS